ncbi:MAG: Uma2 family endonuclease [Bryobacterales bacterium]|nr:Uma2 family endonuclease [Bryobacterales bacterium]
MNRDELPAAEQIRLVAAVSDSSLRFALTTKASLYARAEIPEYWVVDLNARRIVVHREPCEGQYTSVRAYGENEPVCPIAAPDDGVPVASLFG